MFARSIVGLLLLVQIWLAATLGGPPLVWIAALIATLVAWRGPLLPAWTRMSFTLTAIVTFLGVAIMFGAHWGVSRDISFEYVSSWAFALGLWTLLLQGLFFLARNTRGGWSYGSLLLTVVSLFGMFARAGFSYSAISVSSACLSVLLIGLLLDNADENSLVLQWRSSVQRWTATLACAAAVFVCTWYLDEGCVYAIPKAQTWLIQTVNPGAKRPAALRGYVRNATLTSIAMEKTTDPNGLALRVESSEVPGYLRGLAYDTLDGARWFHSTQRGRERFRYLRTIMPSAERRDIVPAPDNELFPVHNDASGPYLKLKISNDSRRGEMYFTPLEADVLEFDGSRLVVDDLQIVKSGINIKKEYLAYVGRTGTPITLDENERARLLTISPYLDSQAMEIGKALCPSDASTVDKIRTIEGFFRKNFQYSLEGFDLPPRTDPLSFFIMEKPAAHCEFFASAAAMFLRLHGVPCRYVTGYVAIHPTWSNNQAYLALNRDAHAWVEAYDDQRKTWVIVEATPGVNVPRTLRDRKSNDENVNGASGVALNEEDLDATTIDWWWWMLRPTTLDSWLRLLSVAGVLGMVAYWAWPRLRGTLFSPLSRTPSDELRRILASMDRRLAQRNKLLQRRPAETLHQFSHRVRLDSIEDPWLGDAADWYERYAATIYGEEITPTTLDRLKSAQPTERTS